MISRTLQSSDVITVNLTTITALRIDAICLIDKAVFADKLCVYHATIPPSPQEVSGGLNVKTSTNYTANWAAYLRVVTAP